MTRSSLFPACLSLTILNIILGSEALAVQNDNLKAYAAAEQGRQRFVLELPKQDDESLMKVELLVGKVEKVDSQNKYFFAGRIEEKTVEGWGFPKYVVEKLGPMAGTLMAVNPDQAKVDRFVGLGGEPFLIRYNSKLPVVVYVPKGAMVKYRIWRAAAETKLIPEG